MVSIFGTPNWEFIINAISISLAIVAIFLSIKYPLNREFDIIHFNYQKGYDNAPGDRGLARTIHKLDVGFKNLGREVLFEKDFLNPVALDVNNFDEFKSVIIESNCKFNSVALEVNNSKIRILPNFIEKYKLIRVRMEFYSELDLDIDIKSKIIGGSAIEKKVNFAAIYEHNYYVGKRQTDIYMYRLPLVVSSAFFLLLIIFEKMFGLNHKIVLRTLLQFNKGSLPLILILLLMIIICWGIALKYLKADTPFSVLFKREKQWFKK